MSRLKLFAGFGIELEYMIVDQATLNVKPLADELIKKVNGHYSNEVGNPLIDWSNELVTHVIELKNNRPQPDILALIPHFQGEVSRINNLLSPMGAQLLPGGCHPWMNPDLETKIWPHENNVIYNTYNKLFGCKGHGWSNLQSMHINIAFATDEEFGRLHTAIRSILPLVPALSSSSPVIDGKITGVMSNRLNHYLKNQKKVPAIMGLCIPDAPQSEAQYKNEILEPMYRDVSVLDTEAVLQEEWLNSRGAIPKFERGCIEIRLADLNEHPEIDCSIAWFWTELLRGICEGRISDLEQLQALETQKLRSILDSTVKEAEGASVTDSDYLAAWGLKTALTGGELIEHLMAKVPGALENSALRQLRNSGSLSTRILKRLGGLDSPEHLKSVYSLLAESLQNNKFF